MCFPTVSCTNTNQWFLWAGQSLDLGNASPTWARTRITASPMHVGDICNLGIACPPNFSNRNLADFIMETVDPQGCAHIAYADDQTTHEVDSADQVSGSCVLAAAVITPTPPMPNTGTAPPNLTAAGSGWLPLALVIAGILAGLLWRAGRRRPEA